ncbi:MAG TPA: hypothetical protein VE987_13710 [Polyangiaceae bacterium]|nr:hypothetical protein [Polyangiaceae bacterium]
MRPAALARFAIVASGLLAAGGSCSFDPVHQNEVDALGGEQPSVPQGEFHRAGQPCVVCHGPEGPAKTQFVMAGTVFAAPDQLVGLPQAEVLLVDSLGSSPPPGSVVTNCVGNFFITSDLWNPAFPVRVAVVSGQNGEQMIGHIGRDGSCADCHKDPRGLDSAGHVFVAAVPPKVSCPVDNVAQVTP